MLQHRKKQIQYTLSTHAIEKLTLSKEAIQLCEQVADGKMKADTAVSFILNHYGLKGAQING